MRKPPINRRLLAGEDGGNLPQPEWFSGLFATEVAPAWKSHAGPVGAVLIGILFTQELYAFVEATLVAKRPEKRSIFCECAAVFAVETAPTEVRIA